MSISLQPHYTSTAINPSVAANLSTQQKTAEENRFQFYFYEGFFSNVCSRFRINLDLYLYHSHAPLHLLNALESKAEAGDDLARLDLAFYWILQNNRAKSQEYVSQVTTRKEEVVFLSFVNQKILSSSDIEWLEQSNSPHMKLLLAYILAQGELVPLDLQKALKLVKEDPGTLPNALMSIILLLQASHFLKNGTDEQKTSTLDFIYKYIQSSAIETCHDNHGFYQSFEPVKVRLMDVNSTTRIADGLAYCKLALNHYLVTFSSRNIVALPGFKASCIFFLIDRLVPFAPIAAAKWMEKNHSCQLFYSFRSLYENAFRLGNSDGALCIADLYEKMGDQVLSRAWGLAIFDRQKYENFQASFLLPFDPNSEVDRMAQIIAQNLIKPCYDTDTLICTYGAPFSPPAPFKSPTEKEKLFLSFREFFAKEEQEFAGTLNGLYVDLPPTLFEHQRALFQRDFQLLIAKWRNEAFTLVKNEEESEFITKFQKAKEALKATYQAKVDDMRKSVLKATPERLCLLLKTILLNKATDDFPLQLCYTQPKSLTDPSIEEHKKILLHTLPRLDEKDPFRNLDICFLQHVYYLYSPLPELTQKYLDLMRPMQYKLVEIRDNLKRNDLVSLLTLLETCVSTLFAPRKMQHLESLKKQIARFEGLTAHPDLGSAFALCIAVFHGLKTSPLSNPLRAFDAMKDFYGSNQQAFLMIYYACHHSIRSYTDLEAKNLREIAQPLGVPIGDGVMSSLCRAFYYEHYVEESEAVNHFPELAAALFAEDSLGEMRIVNAFNMLLSQKKYTEAHDLLLKQTTLISPIFGLFYETGLGVPQNIATAKSYYDKEEPFGHLLLGRTLRKGRVQYYEKHKITLLDCGTINNYLAYFELPSIDLKQNFRRIKSPPHLTEKDLVEQLKIELRIPQKEYAEQLEILKVKIIDDFKEELKSSSSWEECKIRAARKWEQKISEMIQTNETRKRLLVKAQALKECSVRQLNNRRAIDEQIAGLLVQIEGLDLLEKEAKIKESLDSIAEQLVSKDEQIKRLETLLYASNKRNRELEELLKQKAKEFTENDEAMSSVIESQMKQLMALQPQGEDFNPLFKDLKEKLSSNHRATKIITKMETPVPKTKDLIDLLEVIGFKMVNQAGSHRKFQKSNFSCTVSSHGDEISYIVKKSCLETILAYLSS